ncbi:SGNH/GDSL hydrolase family protein [Streptomyces sp. VRA16 Mangrove soil]|uniref:golvesin C-terminal-like domain-containing protein n=1 Tax=Streptomyces sp. VRA16 Mangrove soil TaxID=2817434 RepID=UPI0027DB3B7C|nr:SGNH/GDSL hydrolase family protein [Streptomyces sp. VRA16 Mangrove soil]
MSVLSVLAAMAVAAPLALPAQAQEPTARGATASGQHKPADKAPASRRALPDDKPPTAVPRATRRAVVGSTSDRAWTTSGDATGLHLLVADARAGYAWKTAATLSEPGFETDTWIGNACVTESGRRAVVAYAPRTFTNKPDLMSRGAFTAVVDLTTGKVTKLPVQASLSYFSPGCGAGEKAVLSQFTDDNDKNNATRLLTVDAAGAKAGKPLKLKGQLTSAIPYEDGQLIAAEGASLVRIGADGTRRRIARTAHVPFQIVRDAAGGISFIDRPAGTARGSKASTAARAEVKHLTARTVRATGHDRPRPARTVATGRLTELDLTSSASGEVFVTGKARGKGPLPAHLHNPGTLAKGATIGVRAGSAVVSRWARGKNTPFQAQQATTERTVITDLTVLSTGRKVTLRALPAAAPVSAARLSQGSALSPSLRLAGSAPSKTGAKTGTKAAFASPTDPVEAERTCSVPRGDLRKQAFQPTPRQIEWAVDQAVIGALNPLIYRQPNWKSMGMAGYNPQSLFPLRPLSGDPNGYPDKADNWHIPASIMLGVTAQESNMWQATRFAVPGVTANPLIGNYYGTPREPSGEVRDPWAIDWANADCGYGITQITDGMRLPGHGQSTLTPAQQEAAALDYTANIAAGVDKLSEKWNQTRDAGLVVNNGKPQHIENWYFALWAYNSGFYPEASAADNKGQWGVGWTNNPANPLWKANRTPFLESETGGDDYSDAAHPQDWPYQEKVMGWAARPPSVVFKPGTMAAGYKAAWWNSNAYRSAGLRPADENFCDATNYCNPVLIGPNDANKPGLGACTRDDLHCWLHHSVQWKNCDQAQCGTAVHRFDTTYPEQPDENSYPPKCVAGLPSNALVVDDVPTGVRPAGSDARSCGTITSAGTFALSFAESNGTYPGKIDLHQIGAGYGNHFWFSHTQSPVGENGQRLYTKGTWTLGQNIPGSGWARVMVHMPDHGAHTRQAQYVVGGTDSTSPTRVTPQRTRENRWVDLGAFRFTGTPKVSLSNITADGNGTEDVAWDAVAFQPLPGKPAHQIVAMGDSFSSGEGASVTGGGDYYRETDYRDTNNPATRDACHRSTKAWSRQATLPGTGKSVGALADSRDPSMDYLFIACSGARTYNMLPGSKSQYGELPQLDKGYLDQHTDLVTLSAGGNDAQFTDVFKSCYIAIAAKLGCKDADIEELAADGTPLGRRSPSLATYLPDRFKKVVRPQVVKVLAAIHEKAPQAKIVLMGYPPLLENHGACVLLDSYDNATWLNSIGDVLLSELDGAVADARAQGVDVVFSNPKQQFAGKGICGSPETVHGFVNDYTESDTPLVETDLIKAGTSAQSFHPKIEGARLFADSFEQTMRNLAG